MASLKERMLSVIQQQEDVMAGHIVLGDGETFILDGIGEEKLRTIKEFIGSFGDDK